jgi:hypothetical protein
MSENSPNLVTLDLFNLWVTLHTSSQRSRLHKFISNLGEEGASRILLQVGAVDVGLEEGAAGSLALRLDWTASASDENGAARVLLEERAAGGLHGRGLLGKIIEFLK